MHHILVAEPDNYGQESRDILDGLGEVTYRAMARPDLLREIGAYDVLVVGVKTLVDRELLDAAPRLQVIGSPTTGLDHIDLDYAAARDIAVLSLKGERAFLDTIYATAEHTWALLLALIRRVPWAFNDVLREGWRRERFIGTELHGRTMGIVGLGRVGIKIAGVAATFGMQVIATDPRVKSPDVKPVSLETLLRTSDVVTLHVPLNAETEGMLGREQFDIMERRPVLVNTSRGKIVDEAALLDALDKGQIAGAAVDVLADETSGKPPAADNPLVAYAATHDNLLVTPHLAGATHESMHATQTFIARRIAEQLDKKGS